MLTAGTTANINSPSNSTGKSNHDNAPLPIQTANSPDSSLNHWEITQTNPSKKAQHLNTAPSQESADKDYTSSLDFLADLMLDGIYYKFANIIISLLSLFIRVTYWAIEW
jgi:hypothetical protein